MVPSPSASPRPSSKRNPLKIVRSKFPTTMAAWPRSGASVKPAIAKAGYIGVRKKPFVPQTSETLSKGIETRSGASKIAESCQR